MKNYFLILALFLSLYTTAQTSEQLVAVNQFTNLAAINSISTPIRGSLAFNIADGYLYYYNGTTWIQTPASSTSSSGGWGLNGNSVSSTNFFGTTNNFPIRFIVNNVQRWSILQNGNLVPVEYNIVIGQGAMENTSGALENIAIGINTMANNNGGDYNIAIGKNACLSNVNGVNNLAIGGSALLSNTSNSHNTAIGISSLSSLSNGNNNTAVGSNAMRHNGAGTYNTALGYRAYISGNFSNSTAIGANTGITSNNQVRIGDAVTSIGGPVSWTTLSDKRFKENIKDNVKGLDFILGLKPITYSINSKKLEKFKNETDTIHPPEHYQMLDNIRHIGFLAQDVETLADSLEFDFHGLEKPQNTNDIYGIRYAEFVAPLVKAVQEQQSLIKSLLERIETLENQR